MLIFITALFVMATSTATVIALRHSQHAKRMEYIRGLILPKGLYAQLQKNHPQLTNKDCQLVGRALRQYFVTYAKSGHKPVSMPSQVVDDLWHEFILYTRDYGTFCNKAFGRFFHHTPAIAMSNAGSNAAGLLRCWQQACIDENINFKNPQRIPLLFAIDAKLNIPNGFRYVPNCNGVKREGQHTDSGVVYCAGDFSSSSSEFGTELSSSSDGDSSSSDGCGGGCGGE